MSPMFYSTHPMALLWDCGLGSDPDYSGPCTGTSGTSSPDYLSASAKSAFSSGKGEILAIGAALLVLAGILVMLRMIRKPLGVRTAPTESEELEGYVCRKCGSDDLSGVSPDLAVCGACGFAGNAQSVAGDEGLSDEDFVAKIESLEPGQAWCQGCDLVYWSENDGCPCCGGGGLDDEDWSPDMSPDLGPSICDKCGVTFEPDEGSWVGDTCSACNAAYDEAHALDDIDAGPDDEEAAQGNPDGIGADDEGLRS